jgi:hypothetical protein
MSMPWVVWIEYQKYYIQFAQVLHVSFSSTSAGVADCIEKLKLDFL